MFNQVIIFALAVVAVSAENQYSQGLPVSSRTLVHRISHNNLNNQLQYNNVPNSYYSTPLLSDARPVTHLYVEPEIPLVPTTRLEPITHTVAIARQFAPSQYLGPVTQAFPVSHRYAPAHTVLTHNTATPITQYAAPISRYSAPITQSAPIAYSAPITLSPPVTQALPVTQYYAPVHTAPATQLVTASISQHTAPATQLVTASISQHTAPPNHQSAQYFTPASRTGPVIQADTSYNYAPVQAAPASHYFTPAVTQNTPQYSDSAATVQYSPLYNSRILDYNPYAKGYSVYEPQPDDIPPQEVPRRIPTLNAGYRGNEATSSVRFIQYHDQENNGFDAQIHHDQPLQQTQHTPRYYHH